MNKHAYFISDNTPTETPNVLCISQKENDDIEISLRSGHLIEKDVLIKAKDSCVKNNDRIISLFSQIIDILNEEKVQFWVGKTIYQIVTENVPVDEHRMQWEEQTYINSIIVTAAKIENGKTVLYKSVNGVNVKISDKYYTTREEAEIELNNTK